MEEQSDYIITFDSIEEVKTFIKDKNLDLKEDWEEAIHNRESVLLYNDSNDVIAELDYYIATHKYIITYNE